jgi:ElaB/YqjD/DUF883 family membrane-anchored ribosome-binding protein
MNQQQQRTQMSRESERAPARQSRPQEPFEDLVKYARDYARERPESAALICLGVGFVLGWRLKPW